MLLNVSVDAVGLYEVCEVSQVEGTSLSESWEVAHLMMIWLLPGKFPTHQPLGECMVATDAMLEADLCLF